MFLRFVNFFNSYAKRYLATRDATGTYDKFCVTNVVLQ